MTFFSVAYIYAFSKISATL